jgi:kinesin family member 20
MRCAIIEAETREEVMKEMDERMRSVERMYARRLMNEVCLFMYSIRCKTTA